MDFGGLILVLLIAGVVLALVPVDATIKNIILCLIVVAVILALFHGYSGHHYFSLR